MTRVVLCLLAVAMVVAWAVFYVIPYARDELFSVENLAAARKSPCS
jgi:hypothetical protein